MVDIDRTSPETIRSSLGAIIEQEISQADGAEGNELRGHQEAAMDYYHCRRPAVGEADESDAVSPDLRDMVTAVTAQLTPMISNDALVSFEPRGAEDEDQARMEAMACNRQIMDNNGGYVKLQGCIKDACLARNTFGKVWVEEKDEAEIRRLRVPQGTTAAEIVTALNEPAQVEAELQDTDKDDPSVITVKIVTTTRRFRWRGVDPRRFYYAQGWDEHDLQDIRFCAERRLKSRSDLIAEGYDRKTVEELPKSTKEAEHMAVRAQDRDKTMLQDHPKTKDQELVDVYYCYLLVDLDDDGISERIEAVVADKKHVLEYEQVEVVPYVQGAIMIRANRMQGEDLYDHLKQTQDTKSGLIRRWLDNTRGGTFSRLAVQKGMVDENAEDARNGQFMWTEGPPAEAIMGIPIVDVGPSIEAALNYMDKQRTEGGGASLDMMTSGQNVAGETWRGIMEQYTVKEMMASLFARNLGETLIRNLYLLFHRMMRTHAIDPVGVKLRDRWEMVQPTMWSARTELTVLPGLTPRARAAQSQVLREGLQFSAAALQQGMDGIIADADSIYRTVTDMYRCAGIDSPEQYFVDPSSDKAQENMRRKREQNDMAERRRMELMAMQLRSIELEHKVAARNKSIDARIDVFEAELKATVDLAKAMLTEEGRADDRQLQAAIERARAAITEAGGAGNGQAAGGEA